MNTETHEVPWSYHEFLVGEQARINLYGTPGTTVGPEENSGVRIVRPTGPKPIGAGTGVVGGTWPSLTIETM